jgi:hypothetical protein
VFFSSAQFPGTISTNSLNENSISGNAVGVRYAGTETIDAENNWWGAADGPSGAGPGSGDSVVGATVDFDPFLTAELPECGGALPLGDFRDVRRPGDINIGPDLGGTGHQAINFTGAAGPAGDTWITVYDDPDTPGPSEFTGSVTLSADVLVHRQNNAKGAGLLALYNEPPPVSNRGLALLLIENGNADRLVLATVDGAGKLTTLATRLLGPTILVNQWYRVTMELVVDGANFSVTGTVVRHVDPADPDSDLDTQVDGSLVLAPTSLASRGLTATGEVGIIANATSAIVDSSVTTFRIEQ